MKELIQKYKHIWILLYFIPYLIWFFYLEQQTNVDFHDVSLSIDRKIPFCEWFAIPYFLWFAYIAVAILYFFLKSKEDYYKCCTFLFTGMTICLIIYTIWPNEQTLRPSYFTRDNILIRWVQALYQSDTPTNVCPSIHVLNSIGIHIAICKCQRLKNSKLICCSSFVLAASICLSTMFLKQHSVFDVVCAAGLSCILYLLVYKIDYSRLNASLKEKLENRENYTS